MPLLVLVVPGNKERELFAHFFHYPASLALFEGPDSVWTAASPGITLCLLCSVAAGLLQYKCTATAAPWMVEEDGVGGWLRGWCRLCNRARMEKLVSPLLVGRVSFLCWDLIQFDSHGCSCWCFYHVSRPKSTCIS